MIKERILLVEDNKALSKLIAKKMVDNLDVDVVQAYSLKDAEDAIEENDDFFITLLDLNLPDAPNGEIVDFILEKGFPVIVLTGNIDKKTREEVLAKNVIDYVYKGSIEDVNYIFASIDRLMKNRFIKVMVVEDSRTERNRVKTILQKQMFKVLAAAHGEEALSYLDDQTDVKLILTDYNMPVIDGIELTKRVRETYNKNEIIIISMTNDTDHLISAKFLKIGANDFISKPFSDEELICRINNALEAKENFDIVTKVANLDYLTNLLNRRAFFQKAKEFMKQYDSFSIAMLDIDHFKKINDTYGHDAGDQVIKHLANILKQNTKGSDLIARFGGEEFCVALGNLSEKDAISFFVKLKNKITKEEVKVDGRKIKYTVSIGVNTNTDKKDINELIKEADIALYDAKENGRNRVEVY